MAGALAGQTISLVVPVGLFLLVSGDVKGHDRMAEGILVLGLALLVVPPCLILGGLIGSFVALGRGDHARGRTAWLVMALELMALIVAYLVGLLPKPALLNQMLVATTLCVPLFAPLAARWLATRGSSADDATASTPETT